MVRMAAALLERRFLADYARTGTNMLMLVLVPVTFVIVAAPRLTDAAKVLGGAGGGLGIETVTAGWAAAFLTGIVMYFQVASSRATDRRLVLAGLSRGRPAGLGSALHRRRARRGRDPRSRHRPRRVSGPGGTGAGHRGQAMFAVVYLAIGAVVGALVPTAVHGTVVLLFVWIFDVFIGPTLSGSPSPVLRVLPKHFISLWTVDQPPGHGGPSALPWSGVWIVSALTAAYLFVAATPGRRRAAARHGRRGSCGSGRGWA